MYKKRKSLRTAFDKKVSVTHDGVTSEHHAVSLSEGGIYIRRKNPLRVGTEVDVSVPLKDDETLNMKGNVIYVKGREGNQFEILPGMAVEFRDMSAHDSRKLNSFITDCLTKDIFEDQAESVLTGRH